MDGPLTELAAVAAELDAAAVADEAQSLAERVSEGRFFVACVGQFKRGKSTLINALVGVDILPTGTVPVTSVVTVLRHGPALSVRMRRTERAWETIEPAELVDYVSEERNPGNSKGVIAVEIFVPSQLLASGLCFVDTPGLGSVFAANTAATQEFVPHIDAALAVFGADPPITGEEVALIEDIARDVECIVFVLNKADRVTGPELEQAAHFAERVLAERLKRPVERVFCVSALERLKTGEGTRDWPALTAYLETLAHESGQVLVQSAVDRGVARLSSRLHNILSEEMAALQRPLVETEERIRQLRQASADAARALWELSPLIDAEMQRLSRVFEDRRVAFVREALPAGYAALREAIDASPARFGPALRAAALQAAKQIASDRVLPWLRSSEREAAAEYQEATGRLAEIVNGLLKRLHGSESWSTIPLPAEVGEMTKLRGKNRFYFDTFSQIESPAGLVPLLEWFGDVLLPRSVTRRRVERAASAYYQRLVVANAHRVENSIKQRLQNSRLEMESEVRYVLKEVLDAAERGMERARATQAEGREAVEAAMARLEDLRRRVEAIQSLVQSGA